MTRLKFTRTMMIARWIPTGVTAPHGGHRAFAVSATRPLQKRSEEGSKNEKEDETLEKALEAAESLKEGAKQVKDTCAFVKDTVKTTSNTVTKATNEVSQKVTQFTEAVNEKLKEPTDGILVAAWGKATKRFEDKMVDKIKDRVLSKDSQEEINRVADKAKKD